MEYTGPTEFVHLHNHTLFSILDGVASPDQYFKLCAERKWPAFAVTEHGVLNSIPDCYLSAKETGVKQIVGIEFYFCDYEKIRRKIMCHDIKVASIRKLPELGPRIFRNRHLTVLAKNEDGYRNILKINREAYVDFFYRKPRINFDLLAKYKDNLIVLSGCLNGPISHEIRNGNIDGTKQGKINIVGAVEYIKKFKNLLGDDFYLELQMPGVDGDLEVFARIVEFAHEFGIKTVLTNDCCHPDTLVQTNIGLRKISELKVNDLVFTHSGRFKEIEYINKRSANELVCIQVGSEVHKFTKNHPIAVIVGSSLVWKKAGEIKKQDKLFFPLLVANKEKINDINVFKHVKKRFGTRIENGFIRTSSPKSKNINIPVNLVIDDKLCYIMGLYAAEGDVDKNADYKLSFSFHKNETYQINLIINFFQSFGLSPKVTNVTKNGIRIRICSSIFANLFESLMGNGHKNKHLPYFWNNLNAKQLSMLLAGVIDGDGHLKRSRSNLGFFSTSLNLINDVRMAMMRFGWYSPIKFRKHFTDKRETSNINYWSRLYYLGYSFKNLVGVRISQDQNTRLWHMPAWPNKNDYCDKGFKVNIYKIWNEKYNGNVYNFQVKDDETYCLTNICVHNCHYLHREDYETQKIMMAIDQQCLVDDPNLFHVNSDEQFCKTRADLWTTFSTKGFLERSSKDDFEAACNNTLEIAGKCVPFKPDLGPKLPKIDNADDELRKLAYEGLQRKGFDKDERKFLVDEKMVTHREQLEIELKRIIEKGFSSYFLITRDLIKASTSKGWSVGVGRGSVGGSLLSYLIDIQSLNPLFWGTSFNRFMSPARGGYMLKTTMPEEKK